jgi:hypothetical protein
MLLTIVAIWAVVIPLAVLAVSWQAAKLREETASQTADRPVPTRGRATTAATAAGAVPACAARTVRPRRTITRRVCPELPHGAGRRPASA